jgi:DNA helicase-4
MSGKGVEALADREELGVLNFGELDRFSPNGIEKSVHQNKNTSAILRLIWDFICQGKDIVVLSRRNAAPWSFRARSDEPPRLEQFVMHLRQFLPPEDRKRLAISTAHAFKGLEKEAVIIPDALDTSYPLIHPNWIFLRIFGDSLTQIHDDERRLFYVALTRAGNSLAILTERRRQSPFLDDIRRTIPISSLDWDKIPALPSLDSPRLEVRVYDAYKVKDQLKTLGYKPNFGTKPFYWSKAVIAEGFSFETLMEQPWAAGGVGIEVHSDSGELLHKRT